ncbi:hypothetical protein BCR44DRAFT_241975 [Catenaria anguillulae PL171]|uniref:Uncharacterized protein n=1 Tax=Catenaria anguillulae PL171 TaxID=765915 RepID=A0A1Y2HSV8_9FUNG|nr:hypothetical protein BCR44DRAFT_241975 [Catenaria anguillulae PL171]
MTISRSGSAINAMDLMRGIQKPSHCPSTLPLVGRLPDRFRELYYFSSVFACASPAIGIACTRIILQMSLHWCSVSITRSLGLCKPRHSYLSVSISHAT